MTERYTTRLYVHETVDDTDYELYVEPVQEDELVELFRDGEAVHAMNLKELFEALR